MFITAVIVIAALAAASIGLCKAFNAEQAFPKFVMHHAGRTV